MPEQQTRDELAEKVEELESTVEDLKAFQEWYMNHQKPQVDELQNDLQTEREARHQLEQENNEIQTRLESIISVGDDEQSTPGKRVAVLREALIRRAQSNTNRDEASMHHEEVKNLFADNGHTGKNDKVYNQWRHDAMEDAAEAEGFRLGTKQKDGQSVKAVIVDLDALPTHAPSNDIITSRMQSGAQNHAESD